MESTKTLDQSTDLPVVVSADRSSEQMTAEQEIFPGIADGAASGRFVGQNHEAAHKLKKTSQGKVIIAGGPGSRKTCLELSSRRPSWKEESWSLHLPQSHQQQP